MTELSQRERDDLFRERFGVVGNQPIRKRKGGALVSVSIDGKPVRRKEYRAGSAVASRRRRRTPAELQTWIDELERGGWPED